MDRYTTNCTLSRSSELDANANLLAFNQSAETLGLKEHPLHSSCSTSTVAVDNALRLASGVSPTPNHDLIYQGGKTITNLKFANIYIGGTQSWNGSDVQAIDSSLSEAMSDSRLNQIMGQYFPNQQITSQFLGSEVLNSTTPASVSQKDIENYVSDLYQSGNLQGFDFGSTVFDLMLPRGMVLTEDQSSSLSGLGGFHGSVHVNEQTLYYATGVYSEQYANATNGSVAFDQPWKNVTATFYHELNEARTDPNVEDANRLGNHRYLGWVSAQREECGDFPEKGANSSVFREIPLANGHGTVPVQLQYSNRVHGAEEPLAIDNTQLVKRSIYSASQLDQPLSINTTQSVIQSASQTGNRFVGREITILQSPNVYGQPQPAQAFQTNVEVDFSSPVSAGGLTENNPFNLLITPADTQSLQSPGAISIWSAAAFSLDGGLTNTLAQSWKLNWTDSSHFQGVLVDNRTAEAQTYNLINSPYEVAPNVDLGAFPFAIAAGTTISGAISAQEIDIEIAGNTTDMAHPFRTDIALARG